jgi:predicted nucleic acid-binding protein
MILSAASTVQSDSLSTLRPMFERNNLLKSLGNIFQMVLIIDANIIIRDILWMTRKRTNPAARPEFMELLIAQTVVAIAPTFLIEEMRVNLADLSAKRNISLQALEMHWSSYMKLITFVEMGGPDALYEDPKDAPYLKLQNQSHHLILSKDSDISRMGGRVASTMLVSRLRIYSRHVAIEYTLKAGGAGSIVLSFGLAKSVMLFSRSIFAQAAKLPRWIWAAIVLVVVCACLHAPTRKMLLLAIQNLPQRAKALGNIVLEQVANLTIEHGAAMAVAQDALSLIKFEIPSSGKTV